MGQCVKTPFSQYAANQHDLRRELNPQLLKQELSLRCEQSRSLWSSEEVPMWRHSSNPATSRGHLGEAVGPREWIVQNWMFTRWPVTSQSPTPVASVYCDRKSIRFSLSPFPFPLCSNTMDPSFLEQKMCFIIIFPPPSLTNLNLSIFLKKKTGTFEEINATQHWQNLMKNLTLLSMEKLGLSSGKHSLFIFWKVLFDRPFAVDVTLTKLAVTGLFEYGDRLIIMLKTPDNTAEGKWTGLPISCWKDCGWNRVFCSENSSTNWLH